MVRCLARLPVAAVIVGIATGAAAQDVVVEASVDRATVHENESFNYTIRAEGGAIGEPDVSFLETQFDILNQSTSTQIQLLNGRTQQISEWVYQLMPKKAGAFTLPPLQFGNVLSNEVSIEVLPAVATSDGGTDIFMEVEVTPQEAYVQAQVIYTLRLFVGVSTGRATLTAPPITGGEAILERLGEDQQYQTERGGRNFIVRERRYALFPQQAGPLSIGPVTFEAMVIPSRGFSRVQRLRSETVDLVVLPAVPPPTELTGASWLPASRLTVTERWADGEEAFSLGVPRTRILTIEADGLLETQLPDVETGQGSGIRQYPDQPELTREVTANGLRARRIERYAVIAQNTGDAEIPAVEVPWWNVADKRWEVARLDAHVIPVAPSPQPDVAPPPDAPVVLEAPPATRPTNYWPLISAGLSAAWLATIGLWLRARGGRAVPKRKRRSSAPLAATPSSRRVLKQLRAASLANDGARARDLLLEWAKLQFAADPPKNLGALRERLPEALAAEVAVLEAELYGPAGGSWDGGRLAELLATLDSVRPPAAAAGKDPLVPLYR
jgi:BatD DUF11 like domain